MQYKNKIIEVLKDVTGVEDNHLEVPENQEFGDYTTNFPMQKFVEFTSSNFQLPNNSPINKLTNLKSPRNFAEAVVIELTKNKELMAIVQKMVVAGPGFINFYIKKEILYDTLDHITKRFDTFGKLDIIEGKKVVVEYTDPNPFKEFHIGHLISNVTGESLSRLQEAIGAIVWRADYFGDVGVHVAKSIWGIRKKMNDEDLSLADLLQKELNERINFMGQGYAVGSKAFDTGEHVKSEIGHLNTVLYIAAQRMWEGEGKKSKIEYDPENKVKKEEVDEVYDLYINGRKWSLEYFETIYQRLGTKFDGYYPESYVGEIGYELVRDNIGKVFTKSEGAIIFEGEKFGLHTRVFINKHNLPTYEAKELGLAPAKYKDFAYDKSIIVVGKEIKEYFAVLVEALKQVNPKLGSVTYPICTGMVSVPSGKMGSRFGNIVTVTGLLDSLKLKVLERMKGQEYSEKEKDEISEIVSIGSLKYAFLKNSIGQDFVFDIEQALSLEGNSGPYLQYTYARTRSVLNKSNIQISKYPNKMENGKWKVENNPEEIAILRTLIHFPEVITEAAEKYAPNLICNYLYDLAQKFNGFYNKHRILNVKYEARISKHETNVKLKNSNVPKVSDLENSNLNIVSDLGFRNSDLSKQSFRLALTNATGQVLKNGLELLGIKAPEKM
jgi:arginyl-tRNA synthetase